MLVLLYLAAIVAANLSVAKFGPEASIVNAFLLIGLDLTTRDRLHDKWQKRRLPKMAALIVAGSTLSYILNRNAGPIALASMAAFGAAAIVDATIYHLARRFAWLERVIASNTAGAGVDSIVFPYLAFGGFLWPIVFGQFTAKVAGGTLWALVLNRKEKA